MSSKYLSEFVYGGIDGTITTFVIVAGAMGAELPVSVILTLGMANVIADGFSMALSRYLSAQTEIEQGIQLNKTPAQSAMATFISFVAIGIIPLIAFIVAHLLKKSTEQAYYYAYILTALALYFVGSVKGKILGQSPIQSGMRTVFIGGIAGIISYGIGAYIKGQL
jgi:vacuolar iron transporter family protein